MTKGIDLQPQDGSNLKIGVVRARWNSHMTQPLTDQCLKGLRECGVKEENIHVIDVPGAYEVVYGAKDLIDKKKVDAVVCIGTLVKGATMHFEYISEAVSQGIMNLSLSSGVPVIFGVLTCMTEEQAEVRSIGPKSHGREWGLSAVEMGRLKNK